VVQVGPGLRHVEQWDAHRFRRDAHHDVVQVVMDFHGHGQVYALPSLQGRYEHGPLRIVEFVTRREAHPPTDIKMVVRRPVFEVCPKPAIFPIEPGAKIAAKGITIVDVGVLDHPQHVCCPELSSQADRVVRWPSDSPFLRLCVGWQANLSYLERIAGTQQERFQRLGTIVADDARNYFCPRHSAPHSLC